jgi:hypothetical protein
MILATLRSRLSRSTTWVGVPSTFATFHFAFAKCRTTVSRNSVFMDRQHGPQSEQCAITCLPIVITSS